VVTELTNPELIILFDSDHTEHVENALARFALNDIAGRDLIG
jgi:hypothetical protein